MKSSVSFDSDSDSDPESLPASPSDQHFDSKIVV